MAIVVKLKLTAADLGFASYMNTSRSLDWREARGEDCEGFDVILPRLTLGDVYERAEDIMTAAQVHTAKRRPYTLASDTLADKFGESDGYSDWRDSFEPVMNFVWPVILPYGMDPQDVASRIDRFAGAVSLIYFGEHSAFCGEEYGLALTGGGQDLSDHLAIAYLCAHQIPPVSLLQGLAGVGMSEHKLASVGAALKIAYRKSAEGLRYRAKRLDVERARVFAPKT